MAFTIRRPLPPSTASHRPSTKIQGNPGDGVTLLRLFLHLIGQEGLCIPKDLRAKLRTFVPKPPDAQLDSLAELPEDTVEVQVTPKSEKENSPRGADPDARHRSSSV